MNETQTAPAPQAVPVDANPAPQSVPAAQPVPVTVNPAPQSVPVPANPAPQPVPVAPQPAPVPANVAPQGVPVAAPPEPDYRALYENLRRENDILRHNAEMTQRAPVQGVSGGGAVAVPTDDFIRGFDSDTWGD